MGRMKEVFMDICRENGGELPGEITVSDVAKMKKLEIYNWKEYERKLKKLKEKDKPHQEEAEENQIITHDEKDSNKPAMWSPKSPF